MNFAEYLKTKKYYHRGIYSDPNFIIIPTE